MAVYLLNDIATADVMIGAKDLLDEADNFSKTACEKMPWQPEFKWTRGLVLAKKGHIEEGLSLLKEALIRNYRLEMLITMATRLKFLRKSRKPLIVK